MIDLALFGVDLFKELELASIRDVLGGGLAGKSQLGGLQIQGDAGFGNIGRSDGQVDDVTGSVSGRRALSPEDCRESAAVS
jgi:hypothetical protein